MRRLSVRVAAYHSHFAFFSRRRLPTSNRVLGQIILIVSWRFVSFISSFLCPISNLWRQTGAPPVLSTCDMTAPDPAHSQQSERSDSEPPSLQNDPANHLSVRTPFSRWEKAPGADSSPDQTGIDPQMCLSHEVSEGRDRFVSPLPSSRQYTAGVQGLERDLDISSQTEQVLDSQREASQSTPAGSSTQLESLLQDDLLDQVNVSVVQPSLVTCSNFP